MTAKTELVDLGLKSVWADRLTNHEAEDVLSAVKTVESAHDAAHGNGVFKNSPLCREATFNATLKKLTHRGVPATAR